MSNNEVNGYPLSDMEIDVIGEVMNISMGAAATAMSTILDKKVNITTPRTELIPFQEFEFSYLEPVIGVLIRYIEGIDGSNVLLLREEDLKKILRHLLSVDSEEDIEFDEISLSAICEIMNQMMGSAASALATFLGTVVNISPPQILDVTDPPHMRELFSLKEDVIVSIKFNLIIDDLVESEFLCAMDPNLVKEIVKASLGATEVVEAEKEATATEAAAEASRAAEIPLKPAPIAEPSNAYAGPSAEVTKDQQIQVSQYNYKEFGVPGGDGSMQDNGDNNLELIMTVPIQITVELGRTKKKIKDIAELMPGNIVELDRQAGDQVDILANGRPIARGDVVVVDDNYSVRVTEIIKKDGSYGKKQIKING
ncbi:MAG: flagellar motor switch phosphatase FliY [Eubacteriales bacterium]|jgi:flagellar motor switch protein FliN/FliY|nr:flagellar motor switch phosphatase FliY [Eubacteriales bacterium]MDD3289462.1 flagellar motor switch phosphatase FliY [Eubacteriales bacterium]MDD3863234.1 flagellar motor switch phosphatase FliY [Eubacteriales bacterium]MDD4444368.1 flagellar motor switch phosphatase FliY [Eubacteriales bacterium]